jgi:hypothetical protein
MVNPVWRHMSILQFDPPRIYAVAGEDVKDALTIVFFCQLLGLEKQPGFG